MVAIAFFDVDKTLLADNSATLWIKRELRAGNITRFDAVRALAWVALYGLGVVHADDMLRRAITTLKGKRERDVIDRTLAFYSEEVEPLVRVGARDAIARHKQRGDLVFLLTSSTNYLCAPIADVLRCDGFLANRFEVQDGLFTGAPVEPVSFGSGKLVLAKGCAQKLNVQLEACAFYTDSASDLPVLEAVGEPVVVHPDPRLRRIAKQRGWRIEDWGGATGRPAVDMTAIPPPPPAPQ